MLHEENLDHSFLWKHVKAVRFEYPKKNKLHKIVKEKMKKGKPFLIIYIETPRYQQVCMLVRLPDILGFKINTLQMKLNVSTTLLL